MCVDVCMYPFEDKRGGSGEEGGEGRSITRHIHRLRRTGISRADLRAADAQLPVAVRAPALDPAPTRNDARVF